MNKTSLIASFCLLSLIWSSGVEAQPAYTRRQQAICQPDVFRLCNDAAPDEKRIIACMRAKHNQLSPECRKAFGEGGRHRP